MRRFLICALSCAALVTACSKKPDAAPAANASAQTTTTVAATITSPPAPPPATAAGVVTGSYIANGKAAALTEVTAHADDPFDGKPVTDLVFTTKDQGGDPKAADNAMFGAFGGDAIVVKVEPDGSLVGVDLLHSGLKNAGTPISTSGEVNLKDFSSAGGVISGHLTSGGPFDVFGESLNVDLTFRAKAP